MAGPVDDKGERESNRICYISGSKTEDMEQSPCPAGEEVQRDNSTEESKKTEKRITPFKFFKLLAFVWTTTTCVSLFFLMPAVDMVSDITI